MTASKHTPGPWYGDQEAKDWRGMPITSDRRDGMVEICTIALGFDEPFESEQIANARLIAAAPDMLEALKGILTANIDGKNVERYLDAIDDARAAIAKAEGRTDG